MRNCFECEPKAPQVVLWVVVHSVALSSHGEAIFLTASDLIPPDTYTNPGVKILADGHVYWSMYVCKRQS